LFSSQDKKKLYSKADVDESSDLSKDEVVALNYNILFHKYPRFKEKDPGAAESKPLFGLTIDS